MDWLMVKDRAGWPEHLVYAIEIGFVVAAVLVIVFDITLRQQLTLLAAILSGLAIAYPFALAPLFFDVKGEWMLATLPLSPVVCGVAILLSLKLLRSING